MRKIQPPNQPQQKGHYSPGIALMFAIMLVFISGQFGCNKGEQMSAVANTPNIETQQNNQNAISNIETKVGFVSDEQTAITIALKAWIPIYGKDQIDNEKPYRAKLRNGIWTVEGSLPEGWVGGVAIARISEKDGKVLETGHSK